MYRREKQMKGEMVVSAASNRFMASSTSETAEFQPESRPNCSPEHVALLKPMMLEPLLQLHYALARIELKCLDLIDHARSNLKLVLQKV